MLDKLISFPSTDKVPEVGLINPKIILTNVLLPDPVLPFIATFSPFLIIKFKLFNTETEVPSYLKEILFIIISINILLNI